MNQSQHYDIIVIGSGFVGATVVRALRNTSLNIALVTQESPEKMIADPRRLVLSYGSRLILESFELWPALTPHAFTEVHISAQGQWGAWRMKAAEHNLPALGYAIGAQDLLHTLNNAIAAQANVHHYYEAKVVASTLNNEARIIEITQAEQKQTLSAPLIIAADGVHSTCRQLWNISITESHDEKMAWVSQATVSAAASNIAYQRCTQLGTLAVLPYAEKKATIICTGTREQIDLLTTPQALSLLQNVFGDRLGRWLDVAPGVTYPVRTRQAQSQVVERGVLLGNAAYTITPVAAQGFNLSLQDIVVLTQLLQQHWPDVPKILSDYIAERAPAQKQMISITQRIQNHFTVSSPFSKLLGLLLAGADALPELTRSEMSALTGMTIPVNHLVKEKVV